MTSATLLLFAALAACSWPTDARAELPAGTLVIDPQAPLDTTALGMSTDTYLRQGHPNQNAGTDTLLRVRSNGHNRALLQVDSAALAAATGGGTLLAARLELTITANADNWGPNGREIALHRMTTAWTELGATWNCAMDSVPGNQQAECAGETAWEMGAGGPNPWVATPTATLTMSNGLSGVVTFDVTADVAAWLGGTPNAGWVLKKVNEGAMGRVEFGSRESAHGPRLLLTVSADTSRPVVPESISVPDSASANLVRLPGDSTVLVLRDHVHLRFDDTTSGVTVRAVLARYGATVVGGYPLASVYIVRLPDPGPAYQDLENLMTRLRQEPGVRSVSRIVYFAPPGQLGRFPTDGPGAQRQDWLGQPTDGTRALRAIRAPLAWGCENGLYALGARVGVAIVDDIFDVTGADFDSSSIHPHPVAPTAPLGSPLGSPDRRSHGTGVAGVLTALADNGVGTAGLVWGSDLHPFPLARDPGGTPRRLFDAGGYLTYTVLPTATALSLRVLHSSIEVPVDSTLAADLASAIRVFVNASPGGRLFVQAGQNQRATISADSLLRLRQGDLLIAQALALLRDSPDTARAILVGGTNRDGTAIFDDPSKDAGTLLITGVTSILAPAESIQVLVRPQDFPGQATQVEEGVSFAAPMVSGVAAQLWAFDPTLTADQVRDYILRGAEEPRFDAGAGTFQSPSPMPGSGGLFLLDAYGSLSLLSRERPTTTPVCGGQVWATDASIYVDQGATSLRVIPVQGASFLALASVAPGGRRLAVTDFPESFVTEAWIVSALGSGPRPPDTVLPGVYARQYLERGTADLKTVNPDGTFGMGLMLTLRGTGTNLTDQRLDGLVTPPGATSSKAEDIVVSPLGDLAALHTFADMPNGDATERWDLIGLTGTLHTVGNPLMNLQYVSGAPPCETDCPTGRSNAAWAHDSRRVVVVLPRKDVAPDSGGGGILLGPPSSGAHRAAQAQGEIVAISTRVMSVLLTSGQVVTADSLPLINGAWLLHPRFTADDRLFVTEDAQGFGEPCDEQQREPASPFSVRGSRPALLAAFCDPLDDGPSIFNTPPPVVTAARGGRGASSPPVRRH